AMHVQPATLDTSLDTGQVATLLARELGRAGLPEGPLAPEQIAAEAVRDIQRGQLADAGLWLSLASYRYHQEAMHAATAGMAGFATLPYGVRRSAYSELVVGEMRQFSPLDFHEEMDTVVARLHGRDELEIALQEQMTGLGKT